MFSRIFLLISFPLIYSCAANLETARLESYKTEIIETEIAFARLVREQGMKTGFLAYAADDAVLNRNNNLIKGKPAIEKYFDSLTLEDVVLDWYPDFVRVSASGDLAYTYGRYTFEARDAAGKAIKDEGIFHTVWKRQPDGQWRFVWD